MADKIFVFFCHICKQSFPITVSAGQGIKEAGAKFRKEGHSDEKVPALAPNMGRRHQRYDKAIVRHEGKVLAKLEVQRLEAERRGMKDKSEVEAEVS